MPFKLQLVDWRDEHGVSHPEYLPGRSSWSFLAGSRVFNDKEAAEMAAEEAWIEQDCNGVAPVYEVSEVQR